MMRIKMKFNLEGEEYAGCFRDVQVVQGPAGQDGASAYQIAVSHGYTGTEEEWLASLKGEQGAKGEKGEQGIQGIQGVKGDKGDTGEQGAKGDKGDRGEPGDKGPAGKDGLTASVGLGADTYTADGEGKIDLPALPLKGGSLTGDLNLNSHSLVTSGSKIYGIAGGYAIIKTKTFAILSEDVNDFIYMMGNTGHNFYNRRLTAVATPVQDGDAANKAYVDAKKLSDFGTFSAVALPSGQQPTVTEENGNVVLGIPKGEKGDKGDKGNDGTPAEANVPRIVKTQSDAESTILPNVFYVFPEMPSLTVGFAAPSDTTVVNEYRFRFTSGATATTLTLPAAVVGELSIEANRVYEISVIDNYLVYQSWAVSP